MAVTTLLYFKDESDAALKLAELAGFAPCLIERHDFPDGEFKLKLPSTLSGRAVLFRSLNNPNEKLVELVFAAKTAKHLGVHHLTLVAPYLAICARILLLFQGKWLVSALLVICWLLCLMR